MNLDQPKDARTERIRGPARMSVEHFDDPATAPFGATRATTVTDQETGDFGTSYTNADGQWSGCALSSGPAGGKPDEQYEQEV